MSTNHQPASASEDPPLKPLPKRRDRKPTRSMANILLTILETKKRDEEIRKQKEAEELEQQRKQQPEQQLEQQRKQQKLQPEQQQLSDRDSRDSPQSSYYSANSRQQSRMTSEPDPDTQSRSQRRGTSYHDDSPISYQGQNTPDLDRNQTRNSSQGRYPGQSTPKRKPVRQSSNERPRYGRQQSFSSYGDPLPSIESSPAPGSKASRRHYRNSRENSPEEAPRGDKGARRTRSDDKDKHGEKDWQAGKTLVECNKYMLQHELHCDVTFLVGEEEVEEAVMAHSYVLLARSSTFSKLLEKDASKKSKLYSIPGVPVEAFRDMITYMYTDEINHLKEERARALLPLADKFGLEALRRACFKTLMLEMGSETVCTILESAHSYDDRAVYSKCMRFILFTGKEVLKATSFKDLCKECLEKIVSSDDLNAEEVDVFNGVSYWAKVQCSRNKMQPSDENRRKVLEELTFCVRYNQMNVRDFTQYISKRDILTSQEKILLYQFFHGEISDLPSKFQHEKPRNLRQRKTDADNWNEGDASSFKEPDCWDPNNPNADSPVNISPSNGSIERQLTRVTRFKKTDGSWKVNHPDAISFRATETFHLHGVQMYGPVKERCTYEIDISVHDDMKNLIRHETRTVTVEKWSMCDVLLMESVRVPEGRLFTVVAKVMGKEPTERGINGVSRVTAGGVTFEFVESSKSLNGTDVTMGQIPAILFTKC